MTRKKSTSIVFSDTVQAIKDELADVYGLKETISAGLLLFHEKSDEEQIKLIKKIKEEERKFKQQKQQEKLQPDKAIEMFKKATAKLASIKQQDFTKLIPLMSANEQKAMQIIREGFGPEEDKKTKTG